jgi:hypothetical protein
MELDAELDASGRRRLERKYRNLQSTAVAPLGITALDKPPDGGCKLRMLAVRRLLCSLLRQ